MTTSEPVAGPSDQAERMAIARAERERRKAQPRPPPPPKAKPIPRAPKAKPEPVPYKGTENPGVDEQNDVHEVYERIAPHFSQTRHKPWPLISTFLHSLPPNSIGLDSGGGNGKYVPTAREAGVGLVVMDRSLGLLGVARTQAGFGGGQKGKAKASGDEPDEVEGGRESGEAVGECVRGDLTADGWRRGVFDFAISIAAIHHLSTPARRRRSVQALLQPLVHATKPPYARFMIYVWAYEQSSGSKRRMGATAAESPSDSEIAELNERVQDVLVPWVLQAPKPKGGQPASTGEADNDRPADGEKREEAESQVLHRYYHLFVKGELRELVISAVEEGGYAVLPGGEDQSEGSTAGEVKDGHKWLRIRAEGWEADNWWIEGEVGSGPPVLE